MMNHNNTMTKNKILLLLVAVLLVTNIVMLYFFMSKPQQGRGGRSGREAAIRSFLEKEIGFSVQQLIQYDSAAGPQKEKMRTLLDSMRMTKEQMLKGLAAADFTDSAMVQVVEQTVAKQQQMELAMLRHLRNVRSFCTPAQQPKFDSLYYKMMGRRGDMNKPAEKRK
jgi:periplasmic protein CpxP/Spy